jgi:hypothetical protein
VCFIENRLSQLGIFMLSFSTINGVRFSTVFGVLGVSALSGMRGSYCADLGFEDEDLIEQACARLLRNLSREEWKDYMSDELYSPTCPKLPVPDK